MKDFRNDNYNVYKCPYGDCNVFYYCSRYLSRHVNTVYHIKTTNKSLKCPIIDCSFQIPIENLLKETYIDHVDNTHPEKKLVCHDMYDNLICIIEDMSPVNLTHEISLSHLIKNEIPIKNISLANIIEKDTEIGKLFSNMIKAGILYARQDDIYKCPIYGCTNEYSAVSSYKAHIKTHKHSVLKIIDYGIAKNLINAEKLISELKTFENVFYIVNIPQWILEEKDFFGALIFANDLRMKRQYKSTNAGIKRKIIEKQNKIRKEDLDLMKSIFNSNQNTYEDAKFIEEIVYKGKAFKVTDQLSKDGFTFANLKRTIVSSACCEYLDLILVGTKEDMEYEKVGHFCDQTGQLHILNYQLESINTIETSFGYPRNISFANGNSLCYILFSDGRIRTLELQRKEFIFTELDVSQVIDFCFLDFKYLIYTDGERLYKRSGSTEIIRSECFESFINSVCIRSSRKAAHLEIQDDYTIPEELLNSDLYKDLKSKTANNNICCSTLDGRIYSLDDNLENKLSLVKAFYTHKIVYSSKQDALLYNDSLYEETKLLYIEESFAKKKFLMPFMFFSCIDVYKGFICGGNTGDIRHIQLINKKKINDRLIYKFIKKGSRLFVLDTNLEFENLKEENFSSCVINLFEIGDLIYIFLKCGIVVKAALYSNNTELLTCDDSS